MLTATAILIVRNKSHYNEFTMVSHPANIAVIFVDGEDDSEVDCKVFGADDGAKARAYAIKASEKQGIKLCGLGDFDAGIWH
jgi:hypothetical protein